ncbi:MAG: (2Fe-2S) ferredoxin domain-containing protein [Planctomycetes bacterium]|nr:(2Fe-2S) ferredoxin domain-containing protein [Planctomycetota bacterium]
MAAALGIGRYRRHILYCTGGSCAPEGEGNVGWTHLKARLKQLVDQGRLPPDEVFRTKVGCLRICRGGPILLIYPEGTWYRGATPEVIDRILEEHLLQGRVVESNAFAHNPLTCELEPPAP